MRPDEQVEYRRLLVREIEAWRSHAQASGDPWWIAIERIPLYFDSLLRLSRDPDLTADERRVVRRVIKYLISPLDLMPEFIYGPDGYREDLALIAMLCDALSAAVGPDVLDRCGLGADDAGLARVRELTDSDLDEDVVRHLEILLQADAVAGDEDLAREDVGAADLSVAAAGDLGAPVADEAVAPDRRRPRPDPHTIVFAGPGTGKTHRIETELNRLLVSEGVSPEHVLVTTFTNKAADELRVRIRARLADAVPHPDAFLQRLHISTIHAFCYSLIAEFHHHILFLKGTFAPLPEDQRLLFLFRHGPGALHLKDLYPKWREERRQTTERWAPTDLFHFYSYVGEVYDFLSEDVMGGAEGALRLRYLEIIKDDSPRTVDESIVHTYPRYWQLIQDEGYLDHSMVLAYAEALLDDPQVRRRVQARYQHILVDEYQDTNPIQDRIFRAIAGGGGRLFAVGDDDQSIYAFRGADVRNAVEFVQRWPGAQKDTLDKNHRSTAAIVEATQALIGRNRTREPKHLETKNPRGELPWLVKAPRDELPEMLGRLLSNLKRAGAVESWNDVALLFRGMTDRVAAYRAALSARDVPSAVVGDRRFMRRPVVAGFMKILEMIGGEAGKITRRKRAHRSFFEALGIEDRDQMLDAVRSWHERFHDGQYETLLDLFYAIINDAGAVDVPDVLPDLGRLSAFVAEAEPQIRTPDLNKRLAWFLSYAQAAADAFQGPEPQPEDAVQIMTIHKSKGLEFPVVVIADVVSGVVPAEFPEDVRTRLRRELAGIDPWLDPVEEERRVLYVGMTRAERLVVLLATPDGASPFLSEFPSRIVNADVEFPATMRESPYGRQRRTEPPLHATHGHVYNFHFCPRRYLLETRYGFAGRAIAPLRAGQSLHRALEIFHRLVRDGAPIPEDRLERIFERSWVQPARTKRAKEEAKALFEVFSTYVRFWQCARERPRVVGVEQPFYVAQAAGVLTGKIDLLRECDGRLELVEFKFHRNPMMPDYPQRQLDHYSLACVDDDPDLVVHYLKENHRETFGRRDPAEIRNELSETFVRIGAGEFDAVPSRERCGICPVRFACGESARAGRGARDA